MSSTDFSTLSLREDLLQNLDSMGFKAMTPIQAQSLPAIIAGKDVIAQGKTGSGKTAAFGLGLLQKLDVKHFRIQAVVLCPTRELADQVATEIRTLARSIHNIKILTLCGGMAFGPQVGSLEHNAHIVVGTPGRIEEHIRKGTFKLGHIKTVVLDEADRMLDMGFQESLDAIMDAMPKHRQTLLFSATYPSQIQDIAARVMNKPVMASAPSMHDDGSIEQHFYEVGDNAERMKALCLLLLEHMPESTLVFCNTKLDAQNVADELEEYGFSAMALHGDLEQRERMETLVRFANKSVSVLVGTDVAARGLDIENLGAVINYHIARDTEVHVHRIGRTGRAGTKGMACSLFAPKEHYKMSLLGEYLGQDIVGEALPSEDVLDRDPMKPVMVTLQIDGGKKQKLRPGDIVGALTGKDGIEGKQVGKIHVMDRYAYVAVHKAAAKVALNKLIQGQMKGRNFRARWVGY